ncbi:MAG: response regulator transcription factor, partial [Bacteroidota bacterium]
MSVSAKILVADDDREIVRLIGDSLEDEGYQILPAYNGKEVLEHLEQTDVSLIILDIMMPEMDGLEVCQKIRHQIAAPIILLSAKGREIDKVVGLEVGADDYLTKPFSVNELIARVKAHLRREKRSNKVEKNHTSFGFDDITIHKEKYEVYKN